MAQLQLSHSLCRVNDLRQSVLCTFISALMLEVLNTSWKAPMEVLAWQGQRVIYFINIYMVSQMKVVEIPTKIQFYLVGARKFCHEF